MLDAQAQAPNAFPADGSKMASSIELKSNKVTLGANVDMLVRGQPVTLEIFTDTIFEFFEGGVGRLEKNKWLSTYTTEWIREWDKLLAGFLS